MNRHLLYCMVLTAPTLLLAGCWDEADTEREGEPGDVAEFHPPAENSAPNSAPNSAAENGNTNAADNTGINERDRGEGTLTPFDQAQNGPDIEITAQIRRSVVGSDVLSMNAENVKIITIDGVVTLRGLVATESEKASIEAKAKAVAGVVRVDNQLEVQAL